MKFLSVTAQEGGMGDCFAETVPEVEAHIEGELGVWAKGSWWAKGRVCLRDWAATARLGDVFDHPMGYVVRITGAVDRRVDPL